MLVYDITNPKVREGGRDGGREGSKGGMLLSIAFRRTYAFSE